MEFFLDGLSEAWQLIWSGDPYLMGLLEVTLKLAVVSTVVAALVGIPLGAMIGLGRGAVAGMSRVLANVGLGLPPVAVGLVLILLFLPSAPLGALHLAFTLEGVYVAQTVLALPIVVALTSSAVRDVAPGLLEQARAFGARRHRVLLLGVREARVGVLASLIGGVGSALSEVGAVVLVGGNVEGYNQTLASGALTRVNAGQYAEGLAIAIVLLGLILVVTALLTWLQYGGRRERRLWVAS